MSHTGHSLFNLWTSCALNVGSVYIWEELSPAMQARWNDMAQRLNSGKA